jgi:hypothetical protein
LNNRKRAYDLEKSESIWTSCWLEDDFRSQTLSQIIKDFWLSGIILSLEDLQKYKTLSSLADSLNKTLKDNPRPQLLNIVDLKEKCHDNLGLAIIQRIAFKVFLRKHFSRQ